MSNIITKIISSLKPNPYRHRLALDQAEPFGPNTNPAADMAAKNLGYLSLEDLRSKAAAEIEAEELKVLKAAKGDEAEAERRLYEARERKEAALTTERTRRDLRVSLQRLEATLADRRAALSNSENLQAQMLAFAAELWAEPDPNQAMLSNQLNALAHQRLLDEIMPGSVARLEKQISDIRSQLSKIEA